MELRVVVLPERIQEGSSLGVLELADPMLLKDRKPARHNWLACLETRHYPVPAPGAGSVR